MTLIFALSGSKGASDSLSSIPAPAPLAHQRPGLMPVPMNSTAKRWGCPAVVAAEAELLPKPDSDSSHGKAMVTPAPRRKVLRDNAISRSRRASCCVFILDHLSFCRQLLAAALVEKLATRNDALNYG